MKTCFLLMLIWCVFAGAGCRKSNIDSDRLALLSTDKKWSEAVAGGNIEKIVSFWAEDAIVYFPGQPSAVGKAAIREMVKKNRKIPGFRPTIQSGEAIVSKAGDLGYTLGTVQISVGDLADKPSNRNGNYVHIWKKQANGSWKCAVEIANFRPSSD